MYRSYYHSFWHDDLSDPADIEKYRQRIERFRAIDAQSKPVLFVRAVGTDEEIQHLGTLLDVLTRKFGRFAKLLAIVDFQAVDEPLLVQGYDNLLVYKLGASMHSGHLGEAPYVKPITEAITWAKTGRCQGARSIQSLSSESFSPQKMAWIVPSIYEPFETVPRGGMKPLAPSTGGAMNGLQSHLLPTNNPSPQIAPGGVSFAGGLAPAANVAMKGLRQQPALSQNMFPQVSPKTSSFTPGAFTPKGVTSPLSAQRSNLSMVHRSSFPGVGLAPFAPSPRIASGRFNPVSFSSASSSPVSALRGASVSLPIGASAKGSFSVPMGASIGSLALRPRGLPGQARYYKW
jgi:hypothetical protein